MRQRSYCTLKCYDSSLCLLFAISLTLCPLIRFQHLEYECSSYFSLSCSIFSLFPNMIWYNLHTKPNTFITQSLIINNLTPILPLSLSFVIVFLYDFVCLFSSYTCDLTIKFRPIRRIIINRTIILFDRPHIIETHILPRTNPIWSALYFVCLLLLFRR